MLRSPNSHSHTNFSACNSNTATQTKHCVRWVIGGSTQAFAEKLTGYLDSQRAKGGAAGFDFKEYGRNSISYTSQPNLAGLLDNAEFLTAVMAELKPIYRKSTVVRDSFMAASQQSTGTGKVNMSSYPDNVWARWCAATCVLLIEHIHKLATQIKVYRQVMLQDSGGMKEKIDKLIELYYGGSPVDVGDMIIKQELGIVGLSSSSSSSSFRVEVRRFEIFGGGAMLKACLTGVPELDTEDQETDTRQSLLEEAYAAHVPGSIQNPKNCKKRPAAAMEAQPEEENKDAKKRPAAVSGTIELEVVTEKPESFMSVHGRLSIIHRKNHDAYVSCALGQW